MFCKRSCAPSMRVCAWGMNHSSLKRCIGSLETGGEHLMTFNEQVSVTTALSVARILWPDFVEEHGCVFLGWHSGSNPPPSNDTATGWESFVNHTHIFDEFANDASTFVSQE